MSETIGVLQFIRSGRVAITKSRVERLSDMLAEMERKLQEKNNVRVVCELPQQKRIMDKDKSKIGEFHFVTEPYLLDFVDV